MKWEGGWLGFAAGYLTGAMVTAAVVVFAKMAGWL
jgi:hypothetical protein